jgi:lysophospholipase L1-like esterase
MHILHVTVANKKATYRRRDGGIVCGNDDYRIQFTFDEEWAGLNEKTARFVWGVGQFADIPIVGDTCDVPRLEKIDQVKVGVFAGNLETTTSAVIDCFRSILCEDGLPSVQNDGYWANQARDSADRAAAAAATATEEAEQEVARLVGEIGIAQTLGDRADMATSQKATTAAVRGTYYAAELSVERGKLVDSSSQVVEIGRDNYAVARLDVSTISALYITASADWLNRCYVFYDADGGRVEAGDAGSGGAGVVQITDKFVVVPDNAKTLVVSTANGALGVKINDAQNFADKFKVLGADVEYITAAEYKSGYYLPNGVETAISGDKYKVATYSVAGQSRVLVSGHGTYGSYVYAVYDASGNVLDFLKSAQTDAGTRIEKQEITLAANAATIKVADTDYGSVRKNYVAVPIVTATIKKWAGKKWCCVGDSLTEINSTTTKRYFDYVKDETGIEIRNMGVSGTGYARHQESGKAFYQRIESVPTDVDVVTIFGSGNDGSAGLEIGTPADTGTTTLCGCINTTIDKLYAILPTVPLGIVSPTPWGWQTPDDEGCFMYRYSNALKAICERRGIPFLDLFRQSAFRTMKDGAVNAETHDLLFSSDPVGNCTHPNELGHQLLAPKFRAFLETLIM